VDEIIRNRLGIITLGLWRDVRQELSKNNVDLMEIWISGVGMGCNKTIIMRWCGGPKMVLRHCQSFDASD
jgi:hypothetical protein